MLKLRTELLYSRLPFPIHTGVLHPTTLLYLMNSFDRSRNGRTLAQEAAYEDDLLRRCWRKQDCSSCLSERGPCGWCPTVCALLSWREARVDEIQSSTCVPNRIGILEPVIQDSDLVCPLWSEGWELRSRSLGCHVSTITLLTCITTVFVTICAMGMTLAWYRVGLYARGRCKLPLKKGTCSQHQLMSLIQLPRSQPSSTYLYRKLLGKRRSGNWWKFWWYFPLDAWRGWRMRLVNVRDSQRRERQPLLADGET